MNEHLENFKNKAIDCAATTAQTAKLLAFLSKQKVLIKCEQEKIRRNYAKLGKVYYKDYITDEEPDDAEYQPLCDEISASYQYINQLREEMEDAKDEYREAVTAETTVEANPSVDSFNDDIEVIPLPSET